MPLCRRNVALGSVKREVNISIIQCTQHIEDLMRLESQAGWQWGDQTVLGIKLVAFIHNHGDWFAIRADDGKHYGMLKRNTVATGVKNNQRATDTSYAIGQFNEVLGCTGNFFDAAVDAALAQIQFRVANGVPSRV